jgi:rRNA maturation endonuclease Nob1
MVDEAEILEIPIGRRKEHICEKCKKTYQYSSNDYHPGIICPYCGHGENNPNLRGGVSY